MSLRRVSVWVFGEEGDLLTDPTTQALILASAVLVTGNMMVSPLVADMATVFGVSETYAGWLIISFTAAAAITLPVAGALTDRIGRKPVMTGGFLLFGSAGLAIAGVSRFETALALRALQGIGFAAATPVILTLFGDLYSGSGETTVQAIRVTAASVMNTVTPLLAGVVFVYSWRFPFLIYLVAIPTAVGVWVAIPAVDTTADWSVRRYVRELAAFMSTVEISLLMVSFLLRFVLLYGLITYISVLAVQEAGLAVVAIGALLSLRGITKTFSSTQAGRLAVSYDPAFLAFLSLAVFASGIVLMGLLPTAEVLALGIVVVGTSDGILSPSQKSLVNRLSPAEYRGGMNSTALTFQNAGKVVGPLVLGLFLAVTDTATAFVLLGGIVGVLGAGAMLGVMILQDG